MVANLSASKKGWEAKWEEYNDWAVKGQAYKKTLLALVDEDTNAFNLIMEAFKLPKSTDEEKAARKKAIQDGTKKAIDVPFKVMEVAAQSMEVMEAMVLSGNPSSITDAGVGALCARTAVIGAHINIKTNASSFDDKNYLKSILDKASALELKTVETEKRILETVNKVIAG